ncbi:MAG: GNAT family N-acetyltransferase [Candidatus Riflebacteria bacterium]
MENGKIRLKRPQWQDMEFIRWLWNDEETMSSVGGPVYLNEEQARRWFERIVDPGSSNDRFFLIINEKDIPVGEVSFHRLKIESMTAEFNIKIAEKYRNKGYGKVAMNLLLEYFFNEFGGLMMVDNVAIDNHAGQQALLKYGFEHDPSYKDVFRLVLSRQRFWDVIQKIETPTF